MTTVTSDLSLPLPCLVTCDVCGGLTWAVGALPGATLRTAAASAAGERALDCGENQQDQQAAAPGEPAQWSHDGGRRGTDGGTETGRGGWR